MWCWPWSLLLSCFLLLAGCSASYVRIEVYVEGLTDEVGRLRVTPMLEPDAKGWNRQDVTYGLSHFFIELPGSAQGAARITLDGIRRDGCPIASGEASVSLSGSPSEPVRITLKPLIPSGCSVTVQVTGGGTGQIRVDPIGLVCRDSCQRELPRSPAAMSASSTPDSGATSLLLSAEPDPDSILIGWSGACTGTGACSVIAGDRAQGVGAIFVKRQLCSGSAWCWERPLPQGNELRAVAVLSPTEAWAVGLYGTILRWNGEFWAPYASPTRYSLSGLWARNRNDIWAVGTYGTALHWDGVSWSDLGTKMPILLLGVWGTSQPVGTPRSGLPAGDVWAVADSGEIYRWDGTAWRGEPSGVATPLQAVWGSSSTGADVWAVGTNGVILRRSGARWMPVSSGTTDLLTSIWGSSDGDIWAVGLGGTVLHWQGTSWQPVPELTNPAVQYRRVWSTSQSDVWMATNESGIVQFDGQTVKLHGCDCIANLIGIDGSGPNDIWIAGTSGTLTHWNGSHFTATTQHQGIPILAVGDGGGVPWTLDTKGVVLQRSDLLWVRSANSIPVPLAWSSAKIESSTSMWVLGNGVVGAWDGIRWSFYSVPREELRMDLWVSPSRYLWIVGLGGFAARGNLGSLALVPTGTTADLTSVWAAAPDDVWIVGTQGTLLRWQGGRFTSISLGTTKILRAVWGTGPNDVWIAGDDATLIHWDGQRYLQTLAPLAGAQLHRIWGRSATDVWILGAVGLALHWDGKTLTQQDMGTSHLLTSIWGDATGNHWVVGEGGLILHKAPVAAQ